MWPFTSKTKDRVKPVARVAVRYELLEGLCKHGLAAAWGPNTKLVATDEAYLTTTRAEIVKIANSCWKPWKHSAIGGGNCEIQCFRVVVGAYDYAVAQELPGRLAVFAALTAGESPHAYIVALTGLTTVEVYDQTAGGFLDEDEMDSPIRIIYA